MNNDSKLVRVRHLESVAGATKDFVINQIDNIATGSVLDTVAATVDGGLWFELDNSEPVIKFHYGSNNYSITPTIIQELDPELTLSTYNLTINSNMELPYSVTVSYLGNGTLSVSPSNAGRLVGKELDIELSSSGTITFSVSAAPPYRAATATLNYVYNASSGGGGAM